MTAAHQRTDPDAMPTGRVVLKQGHRRYSVRLPTLPTGVRGGEQVATRAASCLLVPQPGDRVLLAFTPELYILAVLDQAEDSPSDIVLDGDAKITTPTGRLDISSAEGVTIASRALSLLTGVLNTRAEKASISIDEVALIAKVARAAADEVALVATSYDAFVERITVRAARVYRAVSEYEQLRARHFDYRAEESAQIRGKHAVLVARDVVKIDGEQIHVG